MAKTAERRHVNGARKPVKQEGDTRSNEANLRSRKSSAAQIGSLMPKSNPVDALFGKICWIVPGDGPDNDWWLRLLVNKDVRGSIREANVFLSINNEPFKLLKRAQKYASELRLKFTAEEYAQISKVLHPRVNVDVVFEVNCSGKLLRSSTYSITPEKWKLISPMDEAGSQVQDGCLVTERRNDRRVKRVRFRRHRCRRYGLFDCPENCGK